MSVPDTLVEADEYGKCSACGWKARLVKAPGTPDDDAICSDCWIQTECEIVDEPASTGEMEGGDR